MNQERIFQILKSPHISEKSAVLGDGANQAARLAMMSASIQGAMAFQKGLGCVHSLSHSLGGVNPRLHHGTLNALFLPAVIRFNAGAASIQAERRMSRMAYANAQAGKFFVITQAFNGVTQTIVAAVAAAYLETRFTGSKVELIVSDQNIGDVNFEEFGEVETCKIITDKFSGRSKGFGFVTMDDDAAGSAIENLNGKSYKDRDLVVNEAKPKRESY